MTICNRGHDHHEPVVDFVGPIAVEHGERDECGACLCGYEDYCMCPGWLTPQAWVTTAYSGTSGYPQGGE